MGELLSQNWPMLLIMVGLALAINTVIIWLVVNKFFGSSGTASWGRCALCGVAMALTFVIGVILIFAGPRGLRRLGFFSFLVGGAVFSELTRTSRGNGVILYIVILALNFGAYKLLGTVDLDPVSVATNTQQAIHHQLPFKDYEAAFQKEMLTRLDGSYNIAFSLPEPGDEADKLKYFIRTNDGAFIGRGEVEEFYISHPQWQPAQAVEQIDQAMQVVAKLKGAGELQRFANEQQSSSAASTANPLDIIDGVRPVELNAPLKEFIKNYFGRVNPDAATATRLLDWKVAGAIDGVTTPTVLTDYAAWDLALGEKELAAFQAGPSKTPAKHEDHRKNSAAGAEPDRVLTMADQKMISALYGEIEVMVEVHAEARTAVQDVFNNKLRYPFQSDSEPGVMGFMLPAFASEGTQYVAVEMQTGPGGAVRMVWQMEGRMGNVWFRITAPVLADPAKNNELLRLLPMQKLKIAQITGQV